MKKIINNKILIIILILFYILMIYTPQTYATSFSDIIQSGEQFEASRKNYLVDGENSDMEIDSEELQEISDTIYNILLILGIVIAVIIGMVLGIKFMTGSIEEQAKVKESLVPYIVGCVVIFGAFTIWKVVLEVLNTTT